jgi:hypothetical protein
MTRPSFSIVEFRRSPTGGSPNAIAAATLLAVQVWSIGFAALPLLLACSGKSSPIVLPADPPAGLAQCAVPDSMIPPDVDKTWTLGRALVVCGNDAGLGGECLSTGDATCPQFAPGEVTCHDACAANDYAVIYGGVGPVEGPTPPSIATCTGGFDGFGGGGSACCPCQ